MELEARGAQRFLPLLKRSAPSADGALLLFHTERSGNQKTKRLPTPVALGMYRIRPP